jgi:hypothetical protein
MMDQLPKLQSESISSIKVTNSQHVKKDDP